MGVVESLAGIVRAYPAARVVAFADLSSSMILASQGTLDMTQEHLDQLCRQARASFDDPLFALSVEAFGEPHGAVVLTDTEIRVFLRSEAEPADAICCICAPGIDLSGFVTKVRHQLDSISGGAA